MDRHKHVAVEGKGESLDQAFERAYEQAKENFHGVKTFEVLRILVHGENPISGYGVVLAPSGH